MSLKYVFADEAGCFEFARKRGASRYFILCTVTMDGCKIGDELIDLRRRLAFDGHEVGDFFHATTDKQAVRDAVFAKICEHNFRIDATLLEKSKAQPQVRISRARFYQYGWYFHFKYAARRIVGADTELLTTAASLGTNRERASFKHAVDDVMRQTCGGIKWAANFCSAAGDPCLQVADYCAWAIQRKWESEKKDLRSHALIKDRIASECDLWASGNMHYY